MHKGQASSLRPCSMKAYLASHLPRVRLLSWLPVLMRVDADIIQLFIFLTSEYAQGIFFSVVNH